MAGGQSAESMKYESCPGEAASLSPFHSELACLSVPAPLSGRDDRHAAHLQRLTSLVCKHTIRKPTDR